MKPEAKDELAGNLAHLIGWIAEEPVLFSRMEEWLHPALSEIGTSENELERIEERLATLSRRLGAPPEFWYRLKGDQSKEVYDEYGASALQEMISYYWRCRRNLLRTHLLFTGVSLFGEHKSIWKQPPNE